MLCLDSFPWAKERAGETTSNRIEIRRSFFGIVILNDGAHPVAFGVSILYFSAILEILFTGQITEVNKKYHLFIHLSILISQGEIWDREMNAGNQEFIIDTEKPAC
jgi:hypothetical protein